MKNSQMKGPVNSNLDGLVNQLVLEFLCSKGRRDAMRLLMQDCVSIGQKPNRSVLDGKGLVEVISEYLVFVRKADQLISFSRKLELFSRELKLLSSAENVPIAQSVAFGYQHSVPPGKRGRPRRKPMGDRSPHCRDISRQLDNSDVSRISTPTELPLKGRRSYQKFSKAPKRLSAPMEENTIGEDILTQLLQSDFPEILAEDINKATSNGFAGEDTALQNVVDYVYNDETIFNLIMNGTGKPQGQITDFSAWNNQNSVADDEFWMTFDSNLPAANSTVAHSFLSDQRNCGDRQLQYVFGAEGVVAGGSQPNGPVNADISTFEEQTNAAGCSEQTTTVTETPIEIESEPVGQNRAESRPPVPYDGQLQPAVVDQINSTEPIGSVLIFVAKTQQSTEIISTGGSLNLETHAANEMSLNQSNLDALDLPEVQNKLENAKESQESVNCATSTQTHVAFHPLQSNESPEILQPLSPRIEADTENQLVVIDDAITPCPLPGQLTNNSHSESLSFCQLNGQQVREKRQLTPDESTVSKRPKLNEAENNPEEGETEWLLRIEEETEETEIDQDDSISGLFELFLQYQTGCVTKKIVETVEDQLTTTIPTETRQKLVGSFYLLIEMISFI